jgi:multiple sugar transport system permease protein
MKKKKIKRLRYCGINPPRFDRSQIKFWLYLLPVAVVMSLPIIFIVGTAFKPVDELFAYPPRLFPRSPTLGHFVLFFNLSANFDIPVTRYFLNSLAALVCLVFLSLVISVSAGYVLSKKRFRGRTILFTINTIALMFASAAVMIPRYFVIKYTGLIDSFWVHIIPGLAMPVGLFLLKQFIDQLPDALFDAAKVDGANDFFIITRIVVPMVLPAVATVAILAFQSSWNSMDASTFYISNQSLKTLPYYVNSMMDRTKGKTLAGFGPNAAGNLLIFIPNLILFIALQSRVMNTMAHSGIK